jgi:hypothetical protein
MTTSPMPLNKIFSKKFIAPWCLNFDFMLQPTDTSEEYSLLQYTRQADAWKEIFPNKDLFPIWLGYTIFLYNCINNIVPKRKLRKFFLCIAFNEFDFLDDGSYLCMPCIYISSTVNKEFILKKFPEKFDKSKEMRRIISGFSACNAIHDFSFHESRFMDPGGSGELIWIYCVPRG